MFHLQTLLPVACLCLLTLSGITSADKNGPAVVTVIVKEDSDAVLPCSLLTKENIELKVFDWKKPAQKDEGVKEVFFYDAGVHYNNGRSGQSEQFKGRVKHFPGELKHGNASITIRNTKVADSGDYTCVFPRVEPRQIFHIKLVVDRVLKDRIKENITGAAPKPSVTSLEETKDWSLLQCEVHGKPEPTVEWQDSSGNKLPAEEPEVSEREGRFYITLQTTVTKTDNYSCVATQETLSHQIDAKIHVYIGGAAPDPYITTLEETKDWSRLQCLVRGAFPKPTVELQDSSGNTLPAEETEISERGGRFYITLQTTVTKTGRYRCVATQETLQHQTEAHVYVFIGGSSTGSVVMALVFAVVVLGILLVGVGVVLLAVLKGYIPLKRSKGTPAETTDLTP